MNQVERATLQLELRIEPCIERHRDAVVGSDGPALLADVLDEHLVGLQLMSVYAKPPTAEFFEAPFPQRRAHVAQ